MTLGVVLAGGEATRLPNKPLLPLKNGRPAITSSIDLFARSGIQQICVVIPPHSVIPDVLDATYDSPLTYVMQHELTGVPHALKIAVEAMNVDLTTQCVMSCCDNVYDDRTQVGLAGEETPIPHAGVRRCPAWQRPYLSMYDEKNAVWCVKCSGDLCIAGWWIMEAHYLERVEPHMTTVEFLNMISAKPDFIPTDHEWWDIGVLEPYVAYWRNGSVLAKERVPHSDEQEHE